MLGLGNTICSNHYPGGGWSPLDEGSSLVAWYEKGEGVTAAVSDKVTLWENKEGTAGYNMVQSTATNQPTFDTTTGAINFDGVDNFLQMTGQITLPNTFTVGIKFNPADTYGTVLLADNTIGNEMFKIMDSDTIRVKAFVDGASPTTVLANLNLGEGAFDADTYVVITRDSSGNMGFWHKGIDQNTSETLSVDYDVDIDAIGRRANTANYFKGDIFDVSIFNATNSTITAQLNTYLSGL